MLFAIVRWLLISYTSNEYSALFNIHQNISKSALSLVRNEYFCTMSRDIADIWSSAAMACVTSSWRKRCLPLFQSV